MKLGEYLVKIKSTELIEEHNIQDGSKSPIIMYRSVEYVKQVSDKTHKFVRHKNNPEGFILAKMNEKVKEVFIKNECENETIKN